MATGPFWYYIQPVGQINLMDNPSYERGTAGAGAIQGATLGSAANEQAFGAWSLAVAPTSNGTSGAYVGTAQAGNGTQYYYSAYVNGSVGAAYMLAVANTSNALVGSVPFIGGGTWQRYVGSYTENSNTTRRIIVRKNGDASQGSYYVDGVDFTPAPLTTHIDGDQEGCAWIGAVHASQSQRDAQSRAGGSVIALADIGFAVDAAVGAGMPPLENSALSYALLPGAEFQRQRAGVRAFSLISTLAGTTWTDLHVVRQRMIDALKIDLTADQQPTRFLYTGGPGTVQIDAALDGGMEGGKPEGFSEIASVRLVAHRPNWSLMTDQGTALASWNVIGSVQYIAYRDPLGVWGTMGAGGTATNGPINTICVTSNNLVVVGGSFGSVAGTATRNMAFYTPASNAWGTPAGGGIVNTTVNEIIESPAVNLFVAFDGSATVSGVTARGIAQYLPPWNGLEGWGTLAGGGVAGGGTIVKGIAFGANGSLYATGQFNAVLGTTAGSVAAYCPWDNTWGTMGAGIGPGVGHAVVRGPDRAVYVLGSYTNAGGTAANGVGRWGYRDNAWGTMAGGIQTGGIGALGAVYDGAFDADGRFYIVGDFGSAGGGSASNAAVFNGGGWAALGSGLDRKGTSINFPVPGIGYIGGQFGTIAGGIPSHGAAYWNGYQLIPLDLLRPSGAILDIQRAASGTLYVAFNGFDIGTVASVAQIVNAGKSEAYPTLRVWNTNTAAMARIYQIVNTTTGEGVYFDLTLLPNEEIVTRFAPGSQSVVSSFRGDILETVRGGLATLRLLPGTNYISFLGESTSLLNSIYWRPQSASFDGGTAL